MMVEMVEGRVQVSGAMTFAQARALCEQGGRLLMRADQASNPLIVDLANVSQVDSSALSVIFDWLRSAGRFRIENPPAGLLALAELYGVDALLSGTVDSPGA